MKSQSKRAMRDVLIEGIYEYMCQDDRIYFLSADFGSPALDAIRNEFRKRFQSVGIAEQNLINVATGLALEGFTVFAYAIAPFITMRAYEQIRTNLSLHSAFKRLNVNLIGVGTGMSYDVSGPTHHCLEDISLMRLLPHIELISPSDWNLTRKLLPYCLNTPHPKYLRLDSKPLSTIYQDESEISLEQGFTELVSGKHICIVCTGYMTHTALKAAQILKKKGLEITVIDLFCLTSYHREALQASLQQFSLIITLEEGFIFRGGLDSLIADIVAEINTTTIKLVRLGVNDQYLFEGGGREYLHQKHGLDAVSIAHMIKTWKMEEFNNQV